ncbi:MAG: hypothetical protein QGG80_05735, partial [Candidatus Krumholzibacteria bacterium]|nr:hypothetical protein [Candidatus Krumholzibacteria bacterium]
MDRPGIVEGHISSDFSALDNLNQQLASLAGSLGWDESGWIHSVPAGSVTCSQTPAPAANPSTELRLDGA